MPTRSQSVRGSKKPENEAIRDEIEAESRPRSMSMGQMAGNNALLNGLAGGAPMVIPLSSGNENMSLIIDPGSESEDEKEASGSENGNPDDSMYSEIDTSKKALERMRNPKIELVDPEGHEEEIQSESEAEKAAEDAQDAPVRKGQHAGKGDLEQASADMNGAKDWNFKALPMEPKKKVSAGNTFMKLLAQAFGYTVGKIFGAVINLGLLPVTAPIIGKAFARSARKKDSMQEKKNHMQVPGWNGLEYDSDKTGGGAVMEDFRRVPTVWSHPIAAKAAEPVNDAGNSDDPRDLERPLPPTVSVLIDQPEEGSEQSIANRNMGHTMLGVEYSRFSRVSNRYERYYVQYGFYPVGAALGVSGSMVMLHRNAVVPGQLIDDWGHSYTISRKFKATDYQVAEIFRASETYADKGYGYFTRNCTTFVKDMVRDVAGIQGSKQIFEYDPVRFGALENLGMAGAISFDLNARAGMENTMMDLGKKTDESYQGFGNKRATKQDYQNYKDSIAQKITVGKFTDIPAIAGENMRRMISSTNFSGELGSSSYSGNMYNGLEKNELNFDKIADAVYDEGSDLKKMILEVLPEDLKQANRMPPELLEILTSITAMANPILNLKSKVAGFANIPGNERKFFTEALTPDDLREAREELSAGVSMMNVLLNRYLKNDKRLHMPVMHFISVISQAINKVDTAYSLMDLGKNRDGELGNIRGDMQKKRFLVSAGGAEARFTPTHYESYLQIFKKPADAVKNYARYLELQKKRANGETLSSAEEKEFHRLNRIEETAMQFDSAHNYMLEKDDYDQKDIEYMFSLGEREKEDGASSDMLGSAQSAAGTYKSLLLEKLFSGMQERYIQEKDLDGVDKMTGENLDKGMDWLDKDLEKCLSAKFTDLVRILEGIMRSQKEPTKEKVSNAFTEAVMNDWLGKIFSRSQKNEKAEFAGVLMPIAFNQLMNAPASKYRKLLDKAVNLIFQ